MSTPSPRPAPERELHAEVSVAAPAEQVWAALTDLRRMPRWSPELVRMLPLKRGGLRVGQTYLGVNRRGAVVWPTRNVVARAGGAPFARVGHPDLAVRAGSTAWSRPATGRPC